MCSSDLVVNVLTQREGSINIVATGEGSGNSEAIAIIATTIISTAGRGTGAAPGPAWSTGGALGTITGGVANGIQYLSRGTTVREHGGKLGALGVTGMAPANAVNSLAIGILSDL